MPDLEMRTVPQQLSRERMHVILFGVLFAASVIGFAFVPGSQMIWCMVVFAAITAQSAYWFWAYSRAYTRCTAAGIDTFGLTGHRDVPWSSVREIGVTSRGSTIVTTTAGRRVRLGAPLLNMSMSGVLDKDYAIKVDQIRACWRTASGGRS